MNSNAKLNPQVEAYLAEVRPFALPVMVHLRELVHKGCPEVEETIKWSRPFFEYRGSVLCNMSAFKEHCSFGFWGQEMAPVLLAAGVVREDGMGSLGKITSVKNLPTDKLMVGWIRQAAGFIASGEQKSPVAARSKVVKVPKVVVESLELMTALKKNKQAAMVFAAFSPSAQREYVEWVAQAKRVETREKRIVQAMEWIAEGKQRNWKYQNC